MNIRLMILSILAALLLSSTLEAAPVSIVKTVSFACDKAGPSRSGSGVLVRQAGRLWVVTSSVVVFHGDKAEGICHRIESAGRTVAARLVAVNVLNGLALLELQDIDGTALADSSLDGLSLAPVLPTETETVELYGFAGAVADAIPKKGVFLTATSTRLALPLTALAEIQGQTAFGMVGGGVVDQQGVLLGIISSLYFNIRPGRPTTLNEHGPDEHHDGAMISLIVPAPTVSAWIDQIQAGDSNKARLDVRENLSDQLVGKRSLSMGGLRLTEGDCRRGYTPTADAGGAVALINGVLANECTVHIAKDEAATKPWLLGNQTALATLQHMAEEKVAPAIETLVDGKQPEAEVYPINLLHSLALIAQGYQPKSYTQGAWRYEGAVKFAKTGRVTEELKLRRAHRVKTIFIRGSIGCNSTVNGWALIGKLQVPGPSVILPVEGGSVPKVNPCVITDPNAPGGSLVECRMSIAGTTGAFLEKLMVVKDIQTAGTCRYDLYTLR